MKEEVSFCEAHKHMLQFEAKFRSIHLPFQNFEFNMANKMGGCLFSSDVFEKFKDIYGPVLQQYGWKEKVWYQETNVNTF